MKFETIFTNFIAYDEIELDNDAILNYCYDKKKEDEKGRVLSNIGGWQSNDLYVKDTHDENILNLIDVICKNFESLGTRLDFNEPERIKIDNYWININKQTNSNNPHDHPNSIFVAVYYVKVPINSGNIVLRTPVGKYDQYIKMNNIKQYNTFNSSTYRYIPKVRDLVIFPAWLYHYVEPNETNEERISIAFNGSYR